MRKLVRRWHVWVLGLLLVAAAGYGVYRVMRPPWTGSEAWAKYRQVRLGMTLPEATTVLGDDYDGGWSTGGGGHYYWFCGDGVVALSTESPDGPAVRNQAVIGNHEFDALPLRGSWWDRVRARLGP
jgi:hypothetical protein